MMNKEALEKIEELQKQINELKESLLQEAVKKKTPFDFEKFLNAGLAAWKEDELKEIGKAFKSQKLADRQNEKDKLIKDLWEWWYLNDGVKLNWNDTTLNKYMLVFSYSENKWIVDDYFYVQYYFDRPHYSSIELAEQALEEFKDRLDILRLPIY